MNEPLGYIRPGNQNAQQWTHEADNSDTSSEDEDGWPHFTDPGEV